MPRVAPIRRADREAEGARLLSEYTPQGYPGLESPALRQEIRAGPEMGLLLFSIQVRIGDSNREVASAEKQSCELFCERQEPIATGNACESLRNKKSSVKSFLYLGPEGFEPTTKGL